MMKVSRDGWLASAMPLALAASPAGAQLVIGAEARVQAASNPLLLTGGDKDAFMGEISVKPEFKTESATGDTFDVAGVLTGRSYSRLYNNYLLGSVRATGEVRRNERFTVKASAAYIRDIAGDTLITNVDGLVSPQSVRNNWQAELGATWRPNARTMILPLVTAERSTFDSKALLVGGTRLRNTSSARAEIGFRRRITANTWIGIRPVADLSRTGGQPDLHRVALFGTVNKRFSTTVDLEVQAGIEHVDGAGASDFGPPRRAVTAFSGSFSLCRTGETTNACLTGAIESEVSALYGFQRRKAVGVNVSKRLDERRTITAALDYQRISAPRNFVLFRDVDGASARLALDWRLTRRVTLTGELQYARRTVETGDKPQSGYAGLRLLWQPNLR